MEVKRTSSTQPDRLRSKSLSIASAIDDIMLSLRNCKLEARHCEASGYACEAGTRVRVASAKKDNYNAIRNRCEQMYHYRSVEYEHKTATRLLQDCYKTATSSLHT